jgi:hypothetical protein
MISAFMIFLHPVPGFVRIQAIEDQITDRTF